MTSCRESSDHGPWNSWDRVPYITDLRNGTASIVPANRHIHHNFIIGNYNSQEAIDTDDGSAYIKVYHNVLVYGNNGLKSDFGGHNEEFIGNVLAFVGSCWSPDWLGGFAGLGDGFWNNSCIFRLRYESDCFPEGKGLGWRVGNNTVYSQSGDEAVCNTTLSNWLAQGHDRGTTIRKWPSVRKLVQIVEATLAQ